MLLQQSFPQRFGAKTMRKSLLFFVVIVLVFGMDAIGQAQQAKVFRIGFLGSFASPLTESFQQGLRELGYLENRNIKIEYRWAAGKVDRLPKLATELAGLNLDVIVTAGTQATQAAKKATAVIPIVIAISSDPVGTGLVNSLARPGGNVTGLSHLNVEVGGKRLELMKEAFPRISEVACSGIRAIQPRRANGKRWRRRRGCQA
jgi:ABC-type uncharacterized transport system substrate-binding protein